MKNKVLLLGSEGFLGRHVKNLLQIDSEVELICHARNMFSLEKVETLLRYLTSLSADTIINCAATVNFSTETPLSDFYSINTLLPALLADYAKSKGAFLIQPSMSIIYGSKTEEISSKSVILTDTPYAESRYLGDRMIEASGAMSCIIRYAGIWGIDGPAHLGINRALRVCKSGTPPIIYEHENRKANMVFRNYIHVDCAAKLIVHCMYKKLEGLFLAGAPTPISIETMMRVISRIYMLNEPEIVQVETKGFTQYVIPSPELKDFILDFAEALVKDYLFI